MINRDILQDININNIVPYKNNPRKNKQSIDFVVESIREFGYGNPIIVDENMEVIAGHTRLMALKKLKWETLPEVVKICGLTEEQKKAYRIADNSTGQKSEWDIELLNIELKDISIDMAKFGLDIPETIEPNEQDDEVPEAPKVAKTVLGDIIELGNHRLMCGDCTILDNVDKLMNGQKADMSFYSPPYNCNNELGTDKERKYINSNDNIDNYVGLIKDSTSLALEYAKEVFVNIQFLSNNKKDVLIWLSELSDFFKDIFFWKKKNCAPAIAKNVANSQTEVFVLFGKNNNRVFGNKRFHGTFYNFIETNSVSGENKFSHIHSAVMPLALPEHFIVNCYKENSKVLDMFGGTGTTLIACEKTNRKCYMMELDPIYCDVIIQRYCDYVGNNKIKVNGIDIEWICEETLNG